MNDAWLKYQKLQQNLASLERVVVAFSGGVDSTFLLHAAVSELGQDNVLALIADSETYPERERVAAVALAAEFGSQYMVLQTSELGIPGYAENPVNRCYFCKGNLFEHMIPVANEKNFETIVFGAIADDLGDFRPGLQAAKEKGIHAPLQEVMLYKNEIRYLSKQMGLRTWDKPSLACLSSRIPYGERITPEKLSMVDKAEDFLWQLGFRQVRVRTHDKIARIEVAPPEMSQILEVASMVVAKFKEFGYRYVTLDLQGYRTGSLNESIGSAEQTKVQSPSGSPRQGSPGRRDL